MRSVLYGSAVVAFWFLMVGVSAVHDPGLSATATGHWLASDLALLFDS